MVKTGVIFRRELWAYFSTPLAYVFIVIFLLLASGLPFLVGGFLDRGQADLQPFFSFHPWLYLLLIPAIGMRLWAGERRSGTVELLLTLPLTTFDAVLGKFLAAWVFAGIALLLTFPMWITVNVLGAPDNGVIFAAYLGSWLMAGSFLAVAGCLSAATRDQVVAFITGAVACFLFLVIGLDVIGGVFEAVLGADMAQPFVELLRSLSVLTHFDQISRGVVDLKDLVFFLSLIVTALVINVALIEMKKGQ